MPSQEEIDQQQHLLDTYRRNLAHELQRAAQYGGPARAPVEVANSIAEARADIQHCKAALRAWGVVAEDHPDDASSAAPDHSLHAAARQLAALPLDTIPDPAPLPSGSRMPFSHNPLFVGRVEDLHTLAAVLKVGDTVAIGQIAAATGLGGIGKTQLAIEFAHRYGQYFIGGVFWLNFNDVETVPDEISECGSIGYMDLHPDFNHLTPEERLQLVCVAWQSPLPRLLIFDNCEDQQLLTQWRPASGGCRILITSRRAHWDVTLGVQPLSLAVLHRKESVTLLHKYRPDLPAQSAELAAIASELGNLPLALHLAGSFLARYRHATTPTAYLAQLRQPDLLHHPSLQGQGLSQATSPTRHEQHVARTFALCYERLDLADPTDALARALLAHAAYFAPGDPIPRDMVFALLELVDRAPAVILQFEDALARLIDLGLLEATTAGALRLHRLLAAFVRAMTNETTVQEALIRQCLRENSRSSQGQPPDERFAYELFRRAVVERNELAWGHICDLYRDLIRSWALLFDLTGEKVEDIIDQSFARFWAVLSPVHFKKFPSVASLLAYFRSVVFAVAIATVHAQPARDRRSGREFTDSPAPEQDVLEAIAHSELWRFVSSAIATEQERVILLEDFVYKLPPRIILARHPDLFIGISQVYMIKRNILTQLRRNPEIQNRFGKKRR